MKLVVKVTSSCSEEKKLGFVESYFQECGIPMAVVYVIEDYKLTTCQLKYLIALGYVSLDEYAKVGLSGLEEYLEKQNK